MHQYHVRKENVALFIGQLLNGKLKVVYSSNFQNYGN